MNNLDGVITGACAEFFLCIVVHDFDFFSFSLEIAKESQFGQNSNKYLFNLYIYLYEIFEISKSSHDFDFVSFSSDEFKLKVIAQLNEKNRFKYI